MFRPLGRLDISYQLNFIIRRVSITVDYKKINIGTFANKQDAVNARLEAEKEYFGEYSYSSSSKLASNY